MSADCVPTQLDICLDYASDLSELVSNYGWSFQRALANILISAANEGDVLGPDEIFSIMSFARELISYFEDEENDQNDMDFTDYCTHRD